MIMNYRSSLKFLRDYLDLLPKKGYGEATKMAQHLNVTPTFISQVLAGTKLLSPEQAEALGNYLGLTGVESEYFFFMIQHERAGTPGLKSFYEKKLNDLRATALKLSERVQFEKTLTEEHRAIFYSNPLYSAVHLYCSTNEKGRSVEEIAQRFEIPRAQSHTIIKFLTETGLCDEHRGLYKMGTQSTHVPNDSPHLLKHHTNWRLRALHAGESLTDQELMYTGNVSLSKEDFAKLREEMVTFIKHFLETVYPSPAEEIACLNLDFFWIRK